MHKKADQLEAELLPFIQKETIIVYMLADSVQTLPPTHTHTLLLSSLLAPLSSGCFLNFMTLFFLSDKNLCYIRIA